MSDLIVTEFMTLDGVVQAPGGEAGHPHSGWAMDFAGPEPMGYKLGEVLAKQSFRLGDTTTFPSGVSGHSYHPAG